MAKTAAELRDLPHDWDSYGGVPASEAAIRTAENLTFVPHSDGGLQLEMHAGGANIEVDIEPDGTVSSVFWERA